MVDLIVVCTLVLLKELANIILILLLLPKASKFELRLNYTKNSLNLSFIRTELGIQLNQIIRGFNQIHHCVSVSLTTRSVWVQSSVYCIHISLREKKYKTFRNSITIQNYAKKIFVSLKVNEKYIFICSVEKFYQNVNYFIRKIFSTHPDRTYCAYQGCSSGS